MNPKSSGQRSLSTLAEDSREAFSFMYRQVADHAVKIKNHPWPQGLGLSVDGHHIVTGPSGATRDIYLKSVIENLKKVSRMEKIKMDISIVLFAEHMHSPSAGILSGQLLGIIEDRSRLAIKMTSSYRYTTELGWTFGDSTGEYTTKPVVFEGT